MDAMPDLELLDCGNGRRPERSGNVIVDRPAPSATMPRALPEADWARPALRWARGAWVRGAAADPWSVGVAGLVLECRGAAGGQGGVFADAARHAARRGAVGGSGGLRSPRAPQGPTV